MGARLLRPTSRTRIYFVGVFGPKAEIVTPLGEWPALLLSIAQNLPVTCASEVIQEAADAQLQLIVCSGFLLCFQLHGLSY